MGSSLRGGWRLLIVLVYLLGAFRPIEICADVVSDWSAVATTAAAANAKRSAGAVSFDLAYVHVAIYDAVNAIDGRYIPFAVKLSDSPVGASQEASKAAAAYMVLKTLYPTQQTFLDSTYASALAATPDGPAKDQGIEVGTTVATQFLALRNSDGRDANVTYVFGSGPGVYQFTPGSAPSTCLTRDSLAGDRQTVRFKESKPIPAGWAARSGQP